jgi:hypothetical protein
MGAPIPESILKKVNCHKVVPFVNRSTTPSFYVHRIPYNYIKAFDFIPYFWNQVDGEKKSEDYKPYYLSDSNNDRVALAILNSNLFFWWWYTLFEGYHCGKHEISAFPMALERMTSKAKSRLIKIADDLMEDIRANKSRKTCFYRKTGKVVYDEFYPRLSKPIIDKVDRVLAAHYGFSEDEIDAIINFDIKYRSDEEVEVGKNNGPEDKA